jgi:two-component system sensor histidine kinase KdpD
LKRFKTRKYKLIAQFSISVGLVLMVASVCLIFSYLIGYRIVALALLMTTSIVAMLFDIIPVLSAAILSAVIWNFFFIPPIYTFHIGNAEDLLMFLLYFLIALVNAVLTFKIREAESEARDKEEKENTIKLYDTLLNSLSHELRTPISTIIGAVDTLKENKENLSPAIQSDLLSEIDTASMRLNRQVENLLNISRLESGMLRPKADWCDINELIHSVIQKSALTGSHTIIFNQNDSLPLFKLDAGLLEQVVYNLIHNAIQYTPHGSRIAIEVYNQSDNCIIIISDNGRGFPPDEINHVFDKFYRLSDTRTGGSGLGLSIVKGFIESQGGGVTLENLKPHGARFTLQIPAETSFLNSLKNE